MAQFGGRADMLTWATVESPPEVVRLLVKHGVRVQGSMALHAAAAANAMIDENTWVRQSVPSRIEIMRILLDAEANVNEMELDPKARRGDHHRAMFKGTPLHYAVNDGCVEAVEYLLGCGADPMAPSWSGATALRIANCYGRRDMIDVLRRHSQHISDGKD